MSKWPKPWGRNIFLDVNNEFYNLLPGKVLVWSLGHWIWQYWDAPRGGGTEMLPVTAVLRCCLWPRYWDAPHGCSLVSVSLEPTESVPGDCRPVPRPAICVRTAICTWRTEVFSNLRSVKIDFNLSLSRLHRAFCPVPFILWCAHGWKHVGAREVGLFSTL